METESHKLRSSPSSRAQSRQGLVEIKRREDGNLLTLGVAAIQAFPVPARGSSTVPISFQFLLLARLISKPPSEGFTGIITKFKTTGEA